MTLGCWDSVPIPLPSLTDPWSSFPAGIPKAMWMGDRRGVWPLHGQGGRDLELGWNVPPKLHQGSHPGIQDSCWELSRAAPASPGLPVPYKLKIKVNYSHETSKSLITEHGAFAGIAPGCSSRWLLQHSSLCRGSRWWGAAEGRCTGHPDPAWAHSRGFSVLGTGVGWFWG